MSCRGLYVLVLEVKSDICLCVGRIGFVCFSRGVYGYVGSAKGAGGVGARVRRHLAKDKERLWWHIDYLTSRRDVEALYVVYAETLEVVEDMLASEIEKSGCWIGALRGFGSTDRGSRTHLFRCRCGFDLCLESLRSAFAELGLDPRVAKLGC